MNDLASRDCVPCRGGVPPLEHDSIQRLLRELDGWAAVNDHHLRKVYEFKNFRESLEFVNRVGRLAEESSASSVCDCGVIHVSGFAVCTCAWELCVQWRCRWKG